MTDSQPASYHWLCTEMQIVRRNLHLSDAEIAGMLNRTPGAVQAFRLYHGILVRRPRLGRKAAADRAQVFVRQYMAGRTIYSIAKEYKCCRNSVYHAIKRAGVFPEKRGDVHHRNGSAVQ